MPGKLAPLPGGKVSPKRAGDRRSVPNIHRSSHTSDLIIGTRVATMPGARRCRVRAGSGWFDVKILPLDEIACLICKFCVSVAASTTVEASLRYTLRISGTLNHQDSIPTTLQGAEA